VRFAVERPVVRRRVVDFRPPRAVVRLAVPRFAVPRFAVLRFAVPRVAVVLRRPVERLAVVLRPPVLARRRVVLRPAPPPERPEVVPLIGEGGGGVGLDGMGVGQTEPGSFCADQSVPSSSCMIPPQIFVERLRLMAYRIHTLTASAERANASAEAARRLRSRAVVPGP
jgi:hypothetical protein